MSRVDVLAMIDSLGAGGAERSFLELLPALMEMDVRLSFLCLDQRTHGYESEVRALGVSVETIEPGDMFARVREARRVIRRTTPDVIHTTLFLSDLVGRLANFGNDTPLITSIVNTTYDESRRLDPRVRPWKLEAARLIDGFGARHWTDHFHALTVVPRARDPHRFEIDRRAERERIRGALKLGDEPVVVSVGREEFQKAHTVLVEAMDLVRREIPDARLVLVGRPGNASEAIGRAVDRLDLTDAVVRTSFRSDVPSLLAAADVFAFPSHYEGFGGAMIEAMAMGTPIVCSDIPVLKEVLGEPDAALFSPPGNPRLLADALVSSLDDDTEAWVRAARARRVFEERYTTEVVAPDMADMYRAVAGAA
jgi:glycosyltransferase involved in cell wall biosynthesis